MKKIYSFLLLVLCVSFLGAQQPVRVNMEQVMTEGRILNTPLFQSKTSVIPKKDIRALDTTIVSYLSQVNPDSLLKTLQGMQDLGTRFCLAPNRKEVATWIQHKFIDVGIPNVVLDSFEIQTQWPFGSGNFQTTWQYNVVATIPGTEHPEQVYIVGGHYDDILYPDGDPFITCPGADDNASSTAASVEMARIMKLKNYTPPVTIKFVAFGAEELGLHGGLDYARKASLANQDIRMMINNDMIGNNSATSNWSLNLQNYEGSENVTNLAKYICANYTSLTPIDVNNNSGGSDSYPFWGYGYQTIFLQENEFSPSYHTVNDVVANINAPYCAEIVRLGFGMLMEAIARPEIIDFSVRSRQNNILLSWKPAAGIAGYNVYRSTTSGQDFVKINSTPVLDTFYVDATPVTDVKYFYNMRAVCSNLEEGPVSNEDWGMLINLNPGVLIVDDCEGGLLNPTDSLMDAFYDGLFNGFNHGHLDVATAGNFSLKELGEYNTVFWHADNAYPNSKLFDHMKDIIAYMKAGGDFFLTTNRTAYSLSHVGTFVSYFSSQSDVFKYFKIAKAEKKANAYFWGANPIVSEYAAVSIDSNKTPTNYAHHLNNTVEAIYAYNGAHPILNYASQFDSTTTNGAMTNMPVGIEYLGDDYKMVVLSFPLYYMKYDEAKTLVNTVMQDKFGLALGMVEVTNQKQQSYLSQNIPNPFENSTEISYYLPKRGHATLSIYNASGCKIATLVNATQNEGKQSVVFNAQHLPQGVYYYHLQTEGVSETRKMIVIGK